MDFNAKRLALLAGVGNPDDRHDIVQEQVQQLNESVEARQLENDEQEVRKAVRRTIQKMISEGAISLQEDSIERELEHLRKNIAADHDHIADLLDDIRDDREEEHRAEHHRDEMHEEEMHEDEDPVVDNPGAKALDDPSRKGDHDSAYDEIMEEDLDEGHHEEDLDEQLKLMKMPARGPVKINVDKLRKHLSPAQLEKLGIQGDETPAADDDMKKESLEEAALKRIQLLAGVEILTEAKEDDVVMGAAQFDRNAPMDTDIDDTNEDEAKLYELEDGKLEMVLDGTRYSLSEIQADVDLDAGTVTMDLEDVTSE